MEYRYLGGSGFRVPALSLGTATFGGGDDFFRAWGSTDVKEASRLIDLSLDAGVTMFDSADAYSNGLAEEILGQALVGRRDRVLISTKATFRTGDGPNDVGSSRFHLIEACHGALKRLRTDHIDLWQLHGFDARTPPEETLRTLDDLVTAGKIRYVGCSNFSGWQLMKSLAVADRYGWPRYVAHQAYYSLIGRELEWELMPLGLDQKVGTVVWSPLAGGRLTGKISRHKPVPAGSRTATLGGMGPAVPQERLHAVVDVLAAVAQEVERSISQVAINWLLQRPTVATVVIGARNEEQLQENLTAADWQLTPAQVKRLDEVSAVPRIYPYWHQQETSPDRNPFPTG